MNVVIDELKKNGFNYNGKLREIIEEYLNEHSSIFKQIGKNIDNLESFKEIYHMMGEYRIGQIIAFYCLCLHKFRKKRKGRKRRRRKNQIFNTNDIRRL